MYKDVTPVKLTSIMNALPTVISKVKTTKYQRKNYIIEFTGAMGKQMVESIDLIQM